MVKIDLRNFPLFFNICRKTDDVGAGIRKTVTEGTPGDVCGKPGHDSGETSDIRHSARERETAEHRFVIRGIAEKNGGARIPVRTPSESRDEKMLGH